MAIINHPDIKVIQSKDEDFQQEHLNFAFLRSLGLEHIGKLSGKNWTDHNVHDPGITMLEMFCYALMDLGYRLRIPIQDLLAQPVTDDQQISQFFSPAQILGNNPTTILDYRKLLIDLPGIKNAWLEPVDQEVALYLDQPITANPTKLTHNEGDAGPSICLNGLYQIFLELEDADPYGLQSPTDANLDTYPPEALKEIKKMVQAHFMAHRNLGEDLRKDSITILTQERIGICVDLDLEADADLEEIYVQMANELRAFLSPELRFYNLQEMLDAGMLMEDIFAGRPYTDQSYGFIKSEELLALKKRREIHLSDIYKLLLNIPGVSSLRKLKLLGKTAEGIRKSGEMVYHLEKGSIPALCLHPSTSRIRMFRKNNLLTLNIQEIQQLFAKALSNNKKIRYPAGSPQLDHQPDKGFYRADLTDYYSIQQEFPRVYGIGEGGLSSNASNARIAKARQLKAYLLFYDQLFASYLAQLGHIGQLFSLQPESQRSVSDRHSYFSQQLDSVPDGDLLSRFDTDSQFFQNESPVRLAIPVDRHLLLDEIDQLKQDQNHLIEIPSYIFGSPSQRQASTEAMMRALESGHYELDAYRQEGSLSGWHFVVDFPNLPWSFFGENRFETEEEAAYAARSVTFWGCRAHNYIPDPIPTADGLQLSFSLSYETPDYFAYLKELTEDASLYRQRRHAFLDHLLARFSEQFTDYASLMYHLLGKSGTTSDRLLEDKSQYLSRYDRLSRQRGKAIDYLQRTWATENMSGLEHRLAGMTGMRYTDKTSLCPFQVFDYGNEYVIQVATEEGQELFRSKEALPSEEEAGKLLATFATALGDPQAYQKEDRSLDSAYRISLQVGLNKMIFHRSFDDPAIRDQQLKALQYRYQIQPFSDSIFPSLFIYHLELYQDRSPQRWRSKKIYDDPTSAEQQVGTFVRRINQQTYIPPSSTKKKAEKLILHPHPDHPDRLLNTLPWKDRFMPSPAQYRWQWVKDGTTLRTSDARFADTQSAIAAFADFLASDPNTAVDASLTSAFVQEQEKGLIFTPATKVYRWNLTNESGKTILTSTYLFSDKRRGDNMWMYFKSQGRKRAHYQVRTDTGGKLALFLYDESGRLIAESPADLDFVGTEESLIEVAMELFLKKRNTRLMQVSEGFGWRMISPSEPDTILLQSYHYFRTAAHCLQAFVEMLEIAIREEQYFLSGDAANLNFSFFLKNKQDQFIAYHPESYVSEEEREAQLRALMTSVPALSLPYAFKEEYRYQVLDNKGQALLDAKGWFEGEKAAQTHCFDLLHILAEQSTIQTTNLHIQNQGSFLVEYQQNIWAESAKLFPDQQSYEREMGTFLEELQTDMYKLKTARHPHEWKFRYFAETGEKQFDWLLESQKAYRSTDAAKKAYQRMLKQVGRWTVKAKESDPSFAIYLGKAKEAIALSRDFASADERMAVQQGFVSDMQRASQLPASIEANSDSFIQLSDRCKDNKTIVYQALDKDHPLAYHPIPQANKDDSLIPRRTLYYRAASGYDFLLIHTSGPIVQKIGLRHHYVLRGLEDDRAYFISYRGYSSPGEAEEAFRQEYLKILAAATDPTVYEVDSQKPGVKILLKDEIQISGNGCLPTNRPWVFVPEETRSYIENELQAPDLTEWLVAYAYTYPVKAVQWTCEPDDCATERAGTLVALEAHRYVFHLADKGQVSIPVALEPDSSDWWSASSYETAEKAMEAFYRFYRALGHFGNYQVWEDRLQERHCHLHSLMVDTEEEDFQDIPLLQADTWIISLHQVVVESKDCFENADEAWQEASTCQESSATIGEKGLTELLKHSCDRSAYYGFWDPNRAAYRLCLVQKNYVTARHPIYFDSPEEAVHCMKKLSEHCICTDADSLAFFYFQLAGKYGFGYCCTLSAEEGASEIVAWKSETKYTDQAEAKKAAEIFCSLIQTAAGPGEIHEHLRLIQLGPCGPYAIELVDSSKELAFYPAEWDSYTDLQAAQEESFRILNGEGLHLLEHILLRPRSQDPDPDPCLLPIWPDKNCGLLLDSPLEDLCLEEGLMDESESEIVTISEDKVYYPFSDPYSFWATALLPAWGERMKYPPFRDLVEQRLYREGPAHIAYNVLWISPRQMCEIEEKYRKWMEALMRLCKCEEKIVEEEYEDEILDPMAAYWTCLCDLTACLCKLRSDESEEEESSETGQTNICEEDESVEEESGPVPKSVAELFQCEGEEQEEEEAEYDVYGAESPSPLEASSSKLSNKARNRKIRQRQAHYKDQLNQLEQEGQLSEKAFGKAQALFVDPTADFAKLNKEGRYLIQHFILKRTGKAKQSYVQLLSLLIWKVLDWQILEKGLPIEQAEIFSTFWHYLTQKKIGHAAIHQGWKSEELAPLVDPDILSAYQDLFS